MENGDFGLPGAMNWFSFLRILLLLALVLLTSYYVRVTQILPLKWLADD